METCHHDPLPLHSKSDFPRLSGLPVFTLPRPVCPFPLCNFFRGHSHISNCSSHWSNAVTVHCNSLPTDINISLACSALFSTFPVLYSKRNTGVDARPL